MNRTFEEDASEWFDDLDGCWPPAVFEQIAREYRASSRCEAEHPDMFEPAPVAAARERSATERAFRELVGLMSTIMAMYPGLTWDEAAATIIDEILELRAAS